jgi:hypothetical protein
MYVHLLLLSRINTSTKYIYLAVHYLWMTSLESLLLLVLPSLLLILLPLHLTDFYLL